MEVIEITQHKDNKGHGYRVSKYGDTINYVYNKIEGFEIYLSLNGIWQSNHFNFNNKTIWSYKKTWEGDIISYTYII